MSGIKVLIDTNVVLDFLFARKPYMESAKKIMRLCKDDRVKKIIVISK